MLSYGHHFIKWGQRCFYVGKLTDAEHREKEKIQINVSHLSEFCKKNSKDLEWNSFPIMLICVFYIHIHEDYKPQNEAKTHFPLFQLNWNIMKIIKYTIQCKTTQSSVHFFSPSDSRLVFQLPVLGVFSCRLCRARSVHFISCSFTDSVEPPLSCSASGNSVWQRNGGKLFHEKERCFTLL